jgi:FdhD protein
MTATGRRRAAVTSADGRLLGLLCLKASRRGFCSDQDVRARALVGAGPALMGSSTGADLGGPDGPVPQRAESGRRVAAFTLGERLQPEDGQLSGRTARRRVLRLTVPAEGKAGSATARADLLAAEEPLGIRANGAALTMTMRTPGDDIELAAGFLVGEAIVRSPGDIVEIKLCDGTSCGHGDHDGLGNIADVSLARGVVITSAARRNFMTTSACGVCGKTAIEDICALPHAALSADETGFSAEVLACLPGRLREAQRVFASTGGLHAAGLFTSSGELIAVREDVGRHNAVDKLVGWAFLAERLPLAGCALLVSGRASFELVQKAVLAGVPLLAAVSAPSSLAADLAEEVGLTLVGFLRGPSMNVYTGAHRISA